MPASKSSKKKPVAARSGSASPKKAPAKKAAAATKAPPARKKPAAKKAPGKKAPAKKAAAKKAAARKPPVKKATVKKTAAKKSATKKAVARKPVAKKPVARKAVARKATARKPVASKAPASKAAPAKPQATKPQAAKPQAAKPQAPKPAAKKSPKPAALAGTKPLAVNPDQPEPSFGFSGPLRGFKPFQPAPGEEYMSEGMREHFHQILLTWKQELMEEVDRTVHHMKDEAANFPDPNDRATQESEFGLELRTRDRERKLLKKIDQALGRITDGTYGFCSETGEAIGLRRLEARPVATLTVEAQERRELAEKQYRDRDDR
jgi:DnaK suppressor protein